MKHKTMHNNKQTDNGGQIQTPQQGDRKKKNFFFLYQKGNRKKIIMYLILEKKKTAEMLTRQMDNNWDCCEVAVIRC